MNLFAHISSLLTLLSLFILGPALGRALLLWWDKRRERTLPSQQIALGLSTMIAVAVLLVFYGLLWKANPRLVAWYSWINTEIPISGDVEVSGGNVDVTGNVEVTGSVNVSGSVDANVTNEPLRVEVDR
jgi:hypothetical protein